MNFYSPVSNTRCHSIGHELNENSKNQNPGRQSREMGKSLGRDSVWMHDLLPTPHMRVVKHA